MTEPLWFVWLCPDCPFTAQVHAWESQRVLAGEHLDAWAFTHQAMHEVSA